MPGLLAICMSVLLLTAWTTKTSPTPPRCTAADTRRNATRVVNDPSSGKPLYFRFCGPARAVVYMNGRSYRIGGGHCYPLRSSRTTRRRLTEIAVGFITNAPAAPGRGIDLPHLEATQRGPVQIDDSEIEVAGTRVAASGTVLVGTGLKSGSFFLYGRDASGPTGVTLAGTWTCG